MTAPSTVKPASPYALSLGWRVLAGAEFTAAALAGAPAFSELLTNPHGVATTISHLTAPVAGMILSTGAFAKRKADIREAIADRTAEVVTLVGRMKRLAGEYRDTPRTELQKFRELASDAFFVTLAGAAVVAGAVHGAEFMNGTLHGVDDLLKTVGPDAVVFIASALRPLGVEISYFALMRSDIEAAKESRENEASALGKPGAPTHSYGGPRRG